LPESAIASPGDRYATTAPTVFAGLILVGTVHHDPAGFRRVRGFLLKYRPEMVLVEISPYSLAYRREHHRTLGRILAANLEAAAAKAGGQLRGAARHPRIAAVRRQIRLPFEYRAAEVFSNETGAHLCAVDDSKFSHRWIETWSELISVENLEVLLSLPETDQSPARAYAEAARRIRDEGPATLQELSEWSDEDERLWRERECFLAANIVSAIEGARPERAVYLGGWQRLTLGGRFPSLRTLLGLNDSQCLLLDRAEASIPPR